MTNHEHARGRFADAILDILAETKERFLVDGGESAFPAITQTDLMEALRERGWKLPPAGFFWSEVQAAGFKAVQPYQVGKVRRVFSDGRAGRALSPYNTIYTI